MPDVILQIDQLTLTSGQGAIVQDFSMEIHRGEIVALTGRSGAGKTSVALAIVGLLPSGVRQVTGQVTWLGTEPALTLPPCHIQWPSLLGRHIGFVQQDVYSAFDPVLRMGKQMMLVVRERTRLDPSQIESEIRRKMEEAGLYDLDRLWNSFPHQLSGGQLQRCQICMAMVMQPELLIVDEPTSAIDKINQAELLDLFARLRDSYRMAVLCITHEPFVVQYLSDREIRLGPMDEAPEGGFKQNSNENDDQIPSLVSRDLMFTYRYGGLWDKQGAVVGPLNFELFPGQCLGLIGESGSGKSTLAQLLVGFLEPQSGSLHVRGREVDFKKSGDIKYLRSRVQVVQQDGRGSLHPHFTIRSILEEVVRAGRRQPMAGNDSIAEILKAVDLPESVLDRKPSGLSGGECLRVSIARALLMKPEILICDESTSALDGRTRDGVLTLLKQLMSTRNLALLFISHDVHLIASLADTIMVMADGSVVETGPAGEVMKYPTHALTKKIFSPGATS